MNAIDNLAQEIVNKYIRSTYKIKIAESFTGGGIASSLIAFPGTSNFLLEGIVCYSNESKVKRLGVSRDTIKQFGAVSKETLLEMMQGLINGCDIVVATTGNAGPTAEKDGEVGRCYIGLMTKDHVKIDEHIFQGNRRAVIEQGIEQALMLLSDL